jgi:hypothetical protein
LKNRKFFVKVNDFETNPGNIDNGVPQGAVISPLLFSIFINDIPKQSKKNNSYSLLFADDLVTFFVFKKYGKISDKINKYLKRIEAWLRLWRMKMSPEKCSYIIFSGNSASNKDLELNLIGEQIPYDKSPVFLGIKFDEHLCFNSQVDFIKSRCQDRVNIIKILSHKSWKLSKKTLLSIYNALVGSILDYSFFIPNRVSDTNMHKLQVIQNTCIKCIFRLPYETPSDLLLSFLDDRKIATVDTRLRYLFTKYIKSSILQNNELITGLVNDYVSAFVESSRVELKSPLFSIKSLYSNGQLNLHAF